MNVSFILPVYNAQDFIKESLKILIHYIEKLELIQDVQIVIVNDGSKDKTLDIITNFVNSNQYEKITFDIVSYEKNMNIGFAIRKGIEKVKNDVVIIMDSDLPFELNIIDDSLKLINSCCLVSVDRTKKADSYKVGFVRLILHKGLIFLIKLMFGKYLKGIDDFVAGFKVIRKKLLDKIKQNLISNTSLIHFEIILYTVIENMKSDQKCDIGFVFPVLKVETNQKTTYKFFKILEVVWKIIFELFEIKKRVDKIV